MGSLSTRAAVSASLVIASRARSVSGILEDSGGL
jgi:hypothetical protein